MPAYEFLSDEWIDAARAIRSELESSAGSVPHRMRMNLVVTDVPFRTGPLDAHVDTSDGDLQLDLGHLDPVDLTVTIDYLTAKAILVDGNAQAGMQAFMAGRIKVDGDLSKLMLLQGAPPDPRAQEIARRLREMTV
jgi:putative sterol carrier protein